jgi:hypothetical protein
MPAFRLRLRGNEGLPLPPLKAAVHIMMNQLKESGTEPPGL